MQAQGRASHPEQGNGAFSGALSAAWVLQKGKAARCGLFLLQRTFPRHHGVYGAARG
ncbi:hypothetical protein BN2497_11247 [Janthinobacterium sp. CG23_2]|nr:hypothetical protein BN2497_11247 [Janthinobacterium sp. CG23_2]CUU32021.1 hypothetical protein BN3177_11247 [Janthinobacterium sp. CG23_2]